MLDLKKFIEDEVFVHLDTKDKYDQTMQFFENNDIRWMEGQLPTKYSVWDDHKEETAIAYDCSFSRDGLRYINKDWYLENGYKEMQLNLEEE